MEILHLKDAAYGLRVGFRDNIYSEKHALKDGFAQAPFCEIACNIWVFFTIIRPLN